ncbi:MAG: LD-carboxypeptidase [Bacteroidetes bacterium]|jgi:muramoyltetrapeptide carboxypeptidase|nr:LD-carboxypeptidase [Bacteroidota bacterium]MBT6687929.1 LD-carboxypeptidase [Bacteroidota bacterium]MBT7143268.1 LD-carboxypeptidase [Bacteroidota bacterium]MBT7490249.1 LD-carboxypeptidase [Bacteroidota bacterium]
MKTPPYLKKGDKIGIVAPARKISYEELIPAISFFKKEGFEVVLGKNIFQSENQFSGTDKQRAADFQEMIDDISIKAIFSARGGYGTIKIIDYLNFEKFVKNPKWIVGYSDLTVLHSFIHEKLEIETLHATMPINFPNDETITISMEKMMKTLKGEDLKCDFPKHKFNRKGTCTAPVVGGNLSILYSLRGTDFDISLKNKILFIEDLDEYLYHIDRMMMNLKVSGKLASLKGLIVGGMDDMNDNNIPFGKSAYEIIAAAVSEYEYPVCFAFDAGHSEPNLPIIFGREIEMKI